LQKFHSEAIDIREKCHSIGVKVHDNFLDEHHLNHKYFYQDLLNKNTLERIKYSPKILKDKLLLKIRERSLKENKNLFNVKNNIQISSAKVVYW